MVVVGHTGSYDLRAFRPDGSLARIVRRDHVPRAPTEDNVEAYIERQAGYSRLTPAAESRRRYRSVPETGEDYILGTRFDEFDVEHVQLWPLERSEG